MNALIVVDIARNIHTNICKLAACVLWLSVMNLILPYDDYEVK